jgi:hypothetical protein
MKSSLTRIARICGWREYALEKTKTQRSRLIRSTRASPISPLI